MKRLFSKGKISVDGKQVSFLFKKGGKTSIVFVHGLGASKETFLEAFERRELDHFSMVAMDLMGFGDSGKPSDFSYQMGDQADIVRNALDLLEIGRFHLVAHSMGGIIGIELAEAIPNRVSSFINVEGNITREDCTMSGAVAKMREEYFAQEGFEKLKQSIAQESEREENSALEEYLGSLARATPNSLHKSAVATVQESTSGNLLTRFAQLPFYKCYIYGEKNRGVFPAEKMLQRKGIPLFYVSNSGHSMMKENPEEFYNLILDIVMQREQ